VKLNSMKKFTKIDFQRAVLKRVFEPTYVKNSCIANVGALAFSA
jgi:hypothetical protein